MPHSNFSKVTSVTSVTTLFLIEERRFFAVTALNKEEVTTVTSLYFVTFVTAAKINR